MQQLHASPRPALAPVLASHAVRVRAYVELTKPRIIELLLVTTVPAMFLAARGWPDPWLVLATLFGGTLSAGGANAVNMFFDRDIDAVMERTRYRPIPSGRVSPRAALIFGFVLAAAGFAWLWLTVNLLAALLASSAFAFYVGVYTLLLKRTTPQNIVIGGAAGAVPALVGWAAVTNGLALPAFILFVLVFLWTPPHFWALSIRYGSDYASAGVPMLPVVSGLGYTAEQILRYAWLLVSVSLLLFPAAQAGVVYLGAAVLLGSAFVWRAIRLRRMCRDHAPAGDVAREAMRLFGFSITYLALLFTAVAVDAVL